MKANIDGQDRLSSNFLASKLIERVVKYPILKLINEEEYAKLT